MKRSSSNSRKRYRKNNPEKIAKPLRTAAARPFSATSPTRTQNATHPRAKKERKSALGRRKCEKRHFQNDLSSAAPSRFLPSKPNLSKIRTSPKNICETRNIFSQNNCAESRRLNVSTASSRGTKTPNRSEPPFLSVTRPCTSWSVPSRAKTPETRKETKFCQTAKKKRKKNLRDSI